MKRRGFFGWVGGVIASLLGVKVAVNVTETLDKFKWHSSRFATFTVESSPVYFGDMRIGTKMMYNGYGWLQRDQLGQIQEVVFLPSDELVPYPANETFPNGYYSFRGVKIPAEEVVRI